MAQRRLDQYRPLVFLGVFLIAWWLIPAVAKTFIRVSFKEFQAPAAFVQSTFEDLEAFWGRRGHSKLELMEAGQEVARQKAFYQIQAQRTESLEAEMQRLERIFNLPGLPRHRHEIARVVRRDLSAWWQHVIIGKGRNYDIPEGAAVVFTGGVVGRVVEVNAFTSRVELVSSPNFRMAATFEGDARPVVYQGIAQFTFAAPKGVVRDAPQDIEVSEQKPRRLVSTRLGGTFPEGLTIGTVNWLEPGNTGIFKTGAVRLDERLLSLHEVAVLVPLDRETAE